MQWRRRIEWTPRDLEWRITMLFIVGSALFALGSFPPYSQLVDGRAVGITFVIGSLFFTTAALSAAVQVIDEDRSDGTRTRWWSESRVSRLRWAAVIQLAGTLLFNVNTIAAMITTFDVEETNRLVWAPDFFGCIAFLAASHLYWWGTRTRNDGHGEQTHDSDLHDSEWWSSLLNYVGSVFFMASALAALTLPTTGEVINTAIVNSGTFLGAICFLVGSYVLLPAADRDPRG
jgi:protein-S-isoprenylcysteine O-methyltransferase Ste14